jgi:uncharacterized protein (DUF1501 family)
MPPTRRDFLRWGSSALLACGTSAPTFLTRSASALAAEPARATDGRVLVVLELSGGNDGLNTVVPHRDDEYRKHRPKLNLASAQGLHKIDDRAALHPALGGLARLLEERQLAIVQSVGYPNPNRSHFESMAIWHSARPNPTAETSGWLARCLDERFAGPRLDTPALHVSEAALPQALAGSQRHVSSLVSLEQFRRRLGVPGDAGCSEQRDALDQVAGQERGEAGSLLQFIERSTLITYASSARLEEMLRNPAGAAGYPEGYGLARRLRLVAQLIKAGLSTAIYYTQLDGFDTHSDQLGAHDALLRAVGDSLQAFLNDVNRSGNGQRVLVLVFSEFGRRLAENGSAGTDHGTAAPVFLLGPGVKPGLHGPHPNLQELDDGDPRHAIDFRQVYAAVLERWLGCPSAAVLGGKFEPLAVLRGGAK